MYSRVRMLCSLSANLTTTMRQSSAMAMNMERRFSTCSSLDDAAASAAEARSRLAESPP